MDLAIRHYIPGRVRLHVPELCRKPSLADGAVAWLRDQTGIKTARLNYVCACLVVEYDRAGERFLQTILARLRRSSVADLAVLLMAGNGSADEASRSPAGALELPAKQSDTKNSNVPPTKSEVPKLFSAQSPLALPTLSLAMALSVNPLVMALNMPLMLWNGLPIARRAWRVWRRESRLNVDFLDTLAIIASVAQGNPLAGSIVTWLIKLGDWIRDLTAAGSRRAISELLEFQSKTAWVKRNG
jgi:cation transport ATPase